VVQNSTSFHYTIKPIFCNYYKNDNAGILLE